MITYEDVLRLNNEDLYRVLNENYPDILQAIEKENYEIEYPKHFLFKEVICDDKVVGFITFELLQYYSNDLALNECYILPEYRGQGLLSDELNGLIESPNLSLYIRRPSKNIVKVLLNNDLAILTEKGFAVSFIPFMVSAGDVYKNKRIKKHVRSVNINHRFMYFSLIYDFNLGSVVFKSAPYYYPFDDDAVLLSKPRLTDINKNINKISPQYLRDLAINVYLNKNLIAELKNDVYSRIRRDFAVENLVGTQNQLNPEFINLLDENNLTIDDGFKIREDIIDSLDEGEIRHKGISIRLNYLMGDYENKSCGIDLKCPHCENQVSFYLKTCPVCGHDLTCENTFNSVKNTILEYSTDTALINAQGDIIYDGSNMYNQLIEWALHRGYDLDEVYEAQCEYTCFELIRNLGQPENYSIGDGFDSINKIREGSGMVYGINHDYIENLTAERYRNDLENKYTISDLKSELYGYDVPFKDCDDREYLIEQIFNDEYFDRFLDEHFVLTEKGEEFLENPVLEYFHRKLSNDYYYCHFKKIYQENKDNLTLDEIADLLKADI